MDSGTNNGDREAGYNGWRNYSTWNITLWLGNDETLYRSLRAKVRCLGGDDLTETDAEDIVTDIIGDATPDGVDTADPAIDWEQVAMFMKEAR